MLNDIMRISSKFRLWEILEDREKRGGIGFFKLKILKVINFK